MEDPSKVKSENQSIVTKVKNPGRIASGKKLAEWNRQNKENLIKNKEQVSASDKSSDKSSEQIPTGHTITLYTFIILAVGSIAALYLYKSRSVNRRLPLTPEPKIVERVSRGDDFFKMR